ncbi:extracellular solute-binding protein [Clostridium sp. C2-6-12]|uniref:extracellular solute-binding protein n=1 Tax=Clostridium sp. C2-6-12 TaxID=2698832 RepID=UPI001FABC486|nr:extracellular solute-binding protein [Clostridium sp. C2-6-12]
MRIGVKSFIKVTTILVMCFFIITGCGNTRSNKYGLDKNNPVAVQIWHYYNGVQKIEFDKMVEEFNKTEGKEKGIIVEAFNQGSANEITEKILDTANKKVGTGKLPDAFMAYADTAYEIDKLGLAADFNDYLTNEEKNEYIESYIDEGKLIGENELKIFPIAKSTETLMVNKTDWDKFQKETNADIKDFETWEGIAKLAKQYYEWTDSKTETLNDGKAFFGRDAMANYMIIGSMQLGKEIFEVTKGKVNINIDENIMKKLWDNFYIPYVNGYYASYGRFRSDDAKTGDIIAFVGSTSGAEYFPDSVITNDEKSYDIESMVLPIPKFIDGENYMVEQGAGMVLIKSDKKHEYAVTEFLKWFTDADRNIEFSIKSGYMPVKKEANNENLIEEKTKTNKNIEISEKSKAAILSAMNQEKSYKFYANKAFDGGNDARIVLEKSLINKAKSDKEEIKKQLVSGISKTEVMKKYETEENFKKWFEDLKNDMKNIQ